MPHNLFYKQHGEIIGNPPAPLLDVDSLARPDHRLYDRYPQIARGPTGIFTFMRGCRFNCSFSFNHAFQKTDLENIALKMDLLQPETKPRYGTVNFVHPQRAWILAFLSAFPFIIRYSNFSNRVLGHNIVGRRLILRLMSYITFFMHCVRPALTLQEFVRHYILEKDQGSGYY